MVAKMYEQVTVARPASFYFKKFLLALFNFFLKILFILRERGRDGEREGEKHHCVVVSYVPPIGDLACNSSTCPDWESKWRPFGSQTRAQCTEQHQPRIFIDFREREEGKERRRQRETETMICCDTY